MEAMVDACRAEAPRIRVLAESIESERRLPRAMVEALAELGCFRMLVPRAFGGGEVSPATMVRVIEEVAATFATTSCASAVDLMYGAGGGSSIYTSSPLQRHFRDIHVATQHAMVAPATFALVGRLLVGLPTDTSLL